MRGLTFNFAKLECRGTPLGNKLRTAAKAGTTGYVRAFRRAAIRSRDVGCAQRPKKSWIRKALDLVVFGFATKTDDEYTIKYRRIRRGDPITRFAFFSRSTRVQLRLLLPCFS